MTIRALPTECQEQILLATWLDKNGIKFYAVPNGGTRPLLEAIKFKRCGVKRGVPDVVVPVPSGSYHGLYLELKRQQGGRLSPEQKEWLKYLRENGYYAEKADGFEEARDIILNYLALTKPAA